VKKLLYAAMRMVTSMEVDGRMAPVGDCVGVLPVFSTKLKAEAFAKDCGVITLSTVPGTGRFDGTE